MQRSHATGKHVEKLWLKQYPAGVPAEIDVKRYASVKQIFEESCTKFSTLPAFINMGVAISYGELDAQSARFAAWLQKEKGFKRGDRIAIMMPNLLQYPVALFGILRAGLTVVNVNPLYTARELEHQLKDSGSRGIVILENFAHTLTDLHGRAPLDAVVTTQIGDLFPTPKRQLVNFVVKKVKKMVPAWSLPGSISFRDVLAAGGRHTLDPVDVGHQDIAFLQYTGGTTGVSKGAMLTHRNMVANVLQASAWLGTGLTPGDEVVITALPLYHIFSLTANCMVFMTLGGKNILITNPRDIPDFVKTLAASRFTVITGVNTLFNALLHAPGFEKLDFVPLKLALGGGMAVQRAVAENWKRVTGKPIVEAYGLTETSPAACINPLDLKDYNGSIGLPIPSTDLSIRDDDGKELAVSEVGELCFKGPQVMRGYWNRDDETVKVLTKDGWLRTGDMGRVDENGFVYIVDRKKDMILVSGFNVYPNEVEDVAMMHPGVRECAAVGVPDEHSGEVVKLFVVRKDPNLTAEELIAHCHKYLTGYKVPKHVEFRTELPKTNVGKILRRELREKH
ncbi:MAG TPA: long-chain-fatty-acid--CoA ligase [Gammaproteobacteria bacterium]|nr:long-chain-fatty-acid--CoA ligase [Gammaproteobacteria bacterium]